MKVDTAAGAIVWEHFKKQKTRAKRKRAQASKRTMQKQSRRRNR